MKVTNYITQVIVKMSFNLDEQDIKMDIDLIRYDTPELVYDKPTQIPSKRVIIYKILFYINQSYYLNIILTYVLLIFVKTLHIFNKNMLYNKL